VDSPYSTQLSCRRKNILHPSFGKKRSLLITINNVQWSCTISDLHHVPLLSQIMIIITILRKLKVSTKAYSHLQYFLACSKKSNFLTSCLISENADLSVILQKEQQITRTRAAVDVKGSKSISLV